MVYPCLRKDIYLLLRLFQEKRSKCILKEIKQNAKFPISLNVFKFDVN